MITANSLAAANVVGIKNTQFAPGVSVLERKICIIGTYEEGKIVPANIPVQVFSAEEVGSTYGFGSMLHRLALSIFRAAQGIETWVIPQPETATGLAASGMLQVVANKAKAGVINLYVAGVAVPVAIEDNDSSVVIANKLFFELSTKFDLPTKHQLVARNSTTTSNQDCIKFTAKTKGPWGNHISLASNLRPGDCLPQGVVIVIDEMTGGSGIPSIDDALQAMGKGDCQNERYFTDIVHGYGYDKTVADALSDYNGWGNDFNGNYKKEIARPFRYFIGDVASGTDALKALLDIGKSRSLDRTGGIIAAPGSPNHPAEIAAYAIGLMARKGSIRPEENYIDEVLDGIMPGKPDARWTDTYDNRDMAVRSGISTTHNINGVLKIQNLVTFYHPDNIPQSSNGYRSMRNVAIIQNILHSTKQNFGRDEWKGITIVRNVSNVTNTISREKVRDIDSVLDELVALAHGFEEMAWIYDSEFTIQCLRSKNCVTLRNGGTGFDVKLPILLSGEGGIMNTTIEFDTNIAVVTGGTNGA